eukprot:6181402-Pyramimonas_sp.AAC.1
MVRIAVVASSEDLAKDVAASLQMQCKVVMKAVAYLGIDSTAGLRRAAKGTRPKLRSRLKAMQKRAKKI